MCERAPPAGQSSLLEGPLDDLDQGDRAARLLDELVGLGGTQTEAYS